MKVNSNQKHIRSHYTKQTVAATHMVGAGGLYKRSSAYIMQSKEHCDVFYKTNKENRESNIDMKSRRWIKQERIQVHMIQSGKPFFLKALLHKTMKAKSVKHA